MTIKLKKKTPYNVFTNGAYYTDGLVQDCSNSIANALDLLQSCTKPSMVLTITVTSHAHHGVW